MNQKNEDTSAFSPLARLFGLVDRPGGADRIFWGLAVICGLLFLVDFTFEKHGHLAAENIPGFFAFYGFVMFTALILAAKLLRVLIRRPEDYYANKAIDSESYPEQGLDRATHDD